MATYHEPTAISGGDNNNDFDLAMRVTGWEWVNVILMFTQTKQSLYERRECESQSDRKVLDWMEEYLVKGIIEAHDLAEYSFRNSSDRFAYGMFTQSKQGHQHRRGIITHSEYWQAFARFLAEYEPF